jgi:hypothetical protein
MEGGTGIEGDEQPEEIPDDSYFALQYVLSLVEDGMLPSSSQSPRLPLAFQHQLYCVVRDRSVVDEEVRAMQHSGCIRALFSHTANTDTILCLTEQYIASVENMAKCVTESRSARRVEIAASLRKFLTWCDVPTLSVIAEELHNGEGEKKRAVLTKEDLTTLLSLHLLIPRRDTGVSSEMFWLSHPEVGTLVSKVLRARSELLVAVNDATGREMTEAELEKRCTRNTAPTATCPTGKRKRPLIKMVSAPLGFKFHLLDLIGSAQLIRIPLPMVGVGHQRYLVRTAQHQTSTSTRKKKQHR